MTKLYTVVAIDENLSERFTYLRTLDQLKAVELVEHLHSISEDYKDIHLQVYELDQPVYLLDVKFKGSAGKMKNVVEVGEPEQDEALNEAIIYKKTQIA